MYVEKLGLLLSENALQALKDGRFDLLRKVTSGDGLTVIALQSCAYQTGTYHPEMVTLSAPAKEPAWCWHR